jgi:hypothetical protein
MLIEKLGLNGESMRTFLSRLNLIHGAFLRIRDKEAEEEAKRRA